MRGPHANPYVEGDRDGEASPFRRAAQEWDSRIGEAVVQARNWRSAFFVTSLALVLTIGGLIYVALLPRRVPYIIEADPEGPAIARGEIASEATTYTPTDVQVRYWVRLFVTSWRRNPTDVGVIKSDEMTAYALVAPRAHPELKAYFAALGGPVVRAKGAVVKVEKLAAIKITDATWQADWIELRWEPQRNEPIRSRWRGLFRVQLRPSRTVDPDNPLNIFIDEFHVDQISEK